MGIKKALVIGFLCFSANPSSAGFYTGNEIYPFCVSNRSFINGYVAGAFDKTATDDTAILAFALDVMDYAAGPKQTAQEQKYDEASQQIHGFCAPKEGLILQQVADIFCQYVTANPGVRQFPADMLLNTALTQTWPCKKK